MTVVETTTGVMMRVATTEIGARSEGGVMIFVIEKSVFSCKEVLQCNSRICDRHKDAFFVWSCT